MEQQDYIAKFAAYGIDGQYSMYDGTTLNALGKTYMEISLTVE